MVLRVVDVNFDRDTSFVRLLRNSRRHAPVSRYMVRRADSAVCYRISIDTLRYSNVFGYTNLF
jgi:hypothetical protein